MHPIERLRWVARSTGEEPDGLAREVAVALADFADDPASLLTACRRLMERHPTTGPVWWVCARTLSSPDPGEEVWRCLDRLDRDPTMDDLSFALADGATVVVVGWSVAHGSMRSPWGLRTFVGVSAAGVASARGLSPVMASTMGPRRSSWFHDAGGVVPRPGARPDGGYGPNRVGSATGSHSLFT